MVQIFKTVGGYNLIALVVAETPETLKNISGKVFSKIQQRYTPLRILPSKRDILFVIPTDKRRISTKDKKVNPCNVDCDPCNRYELKSVSVAPQQVVTEVRYKRCTGTSIFRHERSELKGKKNRPIWVLG